MSASQLLVRLAPVVLALSAPATAQCPGPDGLTGPCCTPVNATLPQFPSITLESTAICYDNCAPTGEVCTITTLGAPVPVQCAVFIAQMQVNDCLGPPIVAAPLRLDYTRTWFEIDPVTGVDRQVWRFTAKGDVALAGPVPGNPCATPTCLLGYPTAFYYGYVDYAQNCISGEWESAGMLFHACDIYIHQQGLSDRPGAWHPLRSYALVWPDTPANPFVPGAFPAPGSGFVVEALREVPPPVVPFCITEEPITASDLIPIISGCLCPPGIPPLIPPQLTASVFTGLGSCPPIPGSFTTLNAFPTVPWFHMMSHSIGSWTTLATYPGPEEVWADEGLFLVHDPCVNADFSEIHYGATTRGGYDTFLLFKKTSLQAAALAEDPRIFVDLASNFSHQIGSGTITPPVLGSVRPTRHLIYVNTLGILEL